MSEHLPVRNSDPLTSASAAARAVTRRPVVREAIIRLLQQEPGAALTHDDIYGMLRSLHAALPERWPSVSPSGVRTRCNELWREGILADAEEFGKSDAGNRAILWKLARP